MAEIRAKTPKGEKKSQEEFYVWRYGAITGMKRHGVCVVIKASRRARGVLVRWMKQSLSGRRALLEGTCGQHDLFPDSSTAKTLPKAEMTDMAKQTACVVSETLHVCHERQQNFLTHLCLIFFRLKANEYIANKVY